MIKVNDYTVYGLHSIERTMHCIKDRTESFDDYFPCRKKNCKLLHVWNRLNLFIGYHNKQLQIVKWTEPEGLWKETTLGYFRFDSVGRKTNLLATKTIDRSPCSGPCRFLCIPVLGLDSMSTTINVSTVDGVTSITLKTRR